MKEVKINIEKINEYQVKRGLSDSEFAKEMGISKSLFSRVKHKKRNAGNVFITGLIKAGMNPKDIFLVKKLTK